MDVIFYGGLPIEPDLDALDARFVKLNAGVVIEHSEIEEILGVPPCTSRYRTVIAAWKTRLLDNRNLVLGAQVGIGYRVLNDTERLDVGVRGVKRGLRQINRSGAQVARIVSTDPKMARSKKVIVEFCSPHRESISRLTQTLLEARAPQARGKK